jgi:outer membrane protein assembly factor BamB
MVAMAALGVLAQSCAGAAPAAEAISVRPLWQAPLPAGVDVPSGTPALGGGRVFVVASGVQAYSLTSGRQLWQSRLRAYIPRALVASANTVIVPESTVSALDAGSGQRRWEFTADANTSLGRAAGDGRSLYVGSAGHRVYSLGMAGGRLHWQVDLGPDWPYPAVVRGIAVGEATVYVSVEQWLDARGETSRGWLVALDGASGAIRWRYAQASGGRRGLSSSPLLTPHLVVVTDFLGNAVEAVDRSSGRPVWRFQGQPGYSGFPEAPVLIGDTLYAGSGDTYVYALALASGEQRWRVKLPSSVSGYARCGQGLLVDDQALTVIDPASGAVVQTEIDGASDFPTSGIAVSGRTAVLLGPRAIHAFHCT